MHCTDIYPRGRGRPDIILFTLAKSIRCYTYKRIQNGNLTSQSSTTKNPDRKTDSATMVFTGYLIPFLTLSTQALASYTGNLNYRSPSLRHARLGIGAAIGGTHRKVERIARRMLAIAGRRDRDRTVGGIGARLATKDAALPGDRARLDGRRSRSAPLHAGRSQQSPRRRHARRRME